MAQTCELTQEVRDAFRALQFAKGKKAENSGFEVKCNKTTLTTVLGEEYDQGTDLAEVAEDLPESAPRILFFSYKWVRDDGRVSFPLCMIFYKPKAVSVHLAMLYSSTKGLLLSELPVQRHFDCDDAEELTMDWLKAQFDKAKR